MEFVLRLERVLPASRSLVFRMQVQPDLFAQWFGPKGFSATEIDFDMRVGGGYRITMQPPDTEAFLLVGEFCGIEPEVRLAYTFRYEPADPDDRDTIVVLSFGDLGGATAVTVEQGTFATEGRRALHEQGWTESLDRLEELLTTRHWTTELDG